MKGSGSTNTKVITKEEKRLEKEKEQNESRQRWNEAAANPGTLRVYDENTNLTTFIPPMDFTSDSQFDDYFNKNIYNDKPLFLRNRKNEKIYKLFVDVYRKQEGKPDFYTVINGNDERFACVKKNGSNNCIEDKYFILNWSQENQDIFDKQNESTTSVTTGGKKRRTVRKRKATKKTRRSRKP